MNTILALDIEAISLISEGTAPNSLWEIVFSMNTRMDEIAAATPAAAAAAGLKRSRSNLHTGVPHLKKNAPPLDPTVNLCLGS